MIYFFDTDQFTHHAADREFVKNAKKYCEENHSEIVWFCHDIEEVFLGGPVQNAMSFS